MSNPLFNTLPANEPDPVKRANWLGRYLDVEKGYDEKLKVVLLDSLSGIDDAFEKVGDSDKIGKRVRKQQLALSNKAVRNTIKEIFGANTNLIKSGQSDAAVAALDAGLYDQRSILATLFKDPIQREQYAKSLRLTAARNIDAVMTRTLETKRPLSQKVYRTEALAKGQVDKIINRALARGDSAADIAKAVKGLIDPNVPGGVSYAARRLGRTEINNAFHAQSIHDAQNTPWVEGMRWNLSKRHEDDPGDECETYYEIGVFDKEHVPDKPHPNCRCFVTPELNAYQDFEDALIQGKYDRHIDEVFGLSLNDSREAMEVSKPLTPRQVREQKLAEIKLNDKDVAWTGPEVAPPAGDTVVDSIIDGNWQSNAFDTYKHDMRAGIRDVQVNGYDGVLPDVPSKNQNRFYTSTEEGRVAAGREIAARAVAAQPTTKPLYRGVMLSQDGLDELIADGEMSIRGSSFTGNPSTAEKFAGQDDSNWVSLDTEGEVPVVFELRPGAKVAEISSGPDPTEWVGFGQFDVVDVKRPVTQGKPIEVMIRQTSMIEKPSDSRRASELSPEMKAKIEAIAARANAAEEAKAAAKKIENKQLSDARAKDRAAKALAESKRIAALKAQAQADAEKRALRNTIDKDKTIPESIEKASTPRQVANYLHDNYLGLRVVGFDTGDINIDFAREIGTAFERQVALHPKTNIRSLRVVDGMDDDNPAITEYNDDGQRRSDIYLNRDYAANYDAYQKLSVENSKKNKKTGLPWHTSRDTSKPFEGMLTHEWGHVLSYSGDGKLEDSLLDTPNGNIGDGLMDEYIAQILKLDKDFDELPPTLQADYEKWILDNAPSEYSFEEGRVKEKINAEELVAEAYAESVQSSSPGTLSKLIHQALLKWIAKNKDMRISVRKK